MSVPDLVPAADLRVRARGGSALVIHSLAPYDMRRYTATMDAAVLIRCHPRFIVGWEDSRECAVGSQAKALITVSEPGAWNSTVQRPHNFDHEAAHGKPDQREPSRGKKKRDRKRSGNGLQ